MVDPGPTHVGFGVGEAEVFLLGYMVQDPQGFGHDLGTDVVSGENGELQSRHGKTRSVAGATGARQVAFVTYGNPGRIF